MPILMTCKIQKHKMIFFFYFWQDNFILFILSLHNRLVIPLVVFTHINFSSNFVSIFDWVWVDLGEHGNFYNSESSQCNIFEN